MSTFCIIKSNMISKVIIGLYLLQGPAVVFGRSYCRTGSSKTEYCTYYCCDGYYSWSYDYCCSNYGSSSNSNYDSINNLDYDSAISTVHSWWEDNVWAAVLIGLGSLGAVVGIIVCFVCCVKGCTTNNRRTGALMPNPNQPRLGLFMMNNAAGLQQQPQQAYDPGLVQQGQAVYPFGFVGTSNTTGQHGSESVEENDVV